MIQEQSSTLVSFLGALQASLAVLLTISYGLVAARWKLINDKTARDISKTCIRLFLPALLITNIGSQLHYDTASKYIPILRKYPALRSSAVEVGFHGVEIEDAYNTRRVAKVLKHYHCGSPRRPYSTQTSPINYKCFLISDYWMGTDNWRNTVK